MTRPARLLPLLCVLSLASFESSAEEVSSSQQDVLGGVVAPVTLPDGVTAVYGFMGVPEVGVGFRQGISGFELEALGRLQWFQLSAALELGIRKRVLKRGTVELAPRLGLGVVFNSGATYLDDDNFSGVLLRVAPGAVATWRVAETAALVGLVDLPLDLGLSRDKARRFQALGGGGAEVYLGNNVSASATGQLGVETFRERPGEGVTRLGYAVRLGLGVRLF